MLELFSIKGLNDEGFLFIVENMPLLAVNPPTKKFISHFCSETLIKKILHTPSKIVITKHQREIIREWSKTNLVIMPEYFKGEEDEELNVFYLEIDDLLPISEDTYVIFPRILNSSNSSVFNVLIVFRNITIAYIDHLLENKDILAVDVAIISNSVARFIKPYLTEKELGILPHKLGVECSFLVFLKNVELPRSANLLCLSKCKFISFARHFTHIYPIMNPKNDSLNTRRNYYK